MVCGPSGCVMHVEVRREMVLSTESFLGIELGLLHLVAGTFTSSAISLPPKWSIKCSYLLRNSFIPQFPIFFVAYTSQGSHPMEGRLECRLTLKLNTYTAFFYIIATLGEFLKESRLVFSHLGKTVNKSFLVGIVRTKPWSFSKASYMSNLLFFKKLRGRGLQGLRSGLKAGHLDLPAMCLKTWKKPITQTQLTQLLLGVPLTN